MRAAGEGIVSGAMRRANGESGSRQGSVWVYKGNKRKNR